MIALPELEVERDIVLSLCIPTYNRSRKVVDIVQHILKCDRPDIEIVVQDNCSPDDTLDRLSTILDPRLHVFKMDENVGGLKNGLSCLMKAAGEYSLICLDKDRVNHHYLGEFVDFLKQNPDVVIGYCSLERDGRSGSDIFEKGLPSLERIGYLSKHPTGFFFKNEYLSKLDIEKRFSSFDKVLDFPFEFIGSELCGLGKAAIIYDPVCSTETREEARSVHSNTYGKATGNRYFFLPEIRLQLLLKYLLHLNGMGLEGNEGKRLVRRMYKQELLNATIEYRKIMEDPDLCSHYHVKGEKISIFRIILIGFMFSSRFLVFGRAVNLYGRVSVVVKVHIEMLNKALKKIAQAITERR
jgi:glycosyltransferase involved in cell wall biosynthesis